MNGAPSRLLIVVLVIATAGAVISAIGGPAATAPAQSRAAQDKSAPIKTDYPATIRQGVCGMVIFYAGDWAPRSKEVAERDMASGRLSRSVGPVVRRVVALELTNLRDAEPNATRKGSGFYDRVNTGFVAEATSNDAGFFEIELPPGRYSLFVVEDDCLYATSRDGQGYIQPVTVEPNKVQRTYINITYKMSI